MKKMLLVLAILAIATPAWAAVVITATDSGGGVATISYDASGEGSLVRAFALDITVTGSATITAAGVVDPNYWVHPGSMTFWAGDVNSEGTAVCDANVYAGTLPGLDTNGLTLEMATLYVGANTPDNSGALCTVTVDSGCSLSVAVNSIRGAVVLEDGTVPTVDVTTGATNIPISFGDCYTGPDVTAWEDRLKPDSWCNPRQCHGDADGLLDETRGKLDYWVSYGDLDLYLDGFPIDTTLYVDEANDPWIAADFDHEIDDTRGKLDYYVSYGDLDIYLAWFPIDSTIGPDANCLD